jgi:hypothetical protein
VGNVWPGWELESGVIPISLIGAEDSELMARVGVTAQQQGEWHKDLRLYWNRWLDEQCSQESVGVRSKLEVFYGGLQSTTRRTRRC